MTVVRLPGGTEVDAKSVHTASSGRALVLIHHDGTKVFYPRRWFWKDKGEG